MTIMYPTFTQATVSVVKKETGKVSTVTVYGNGDLNRMGVELQANFNHYDYAVTFTSRGCRQYFEGETGSPILTDKKGIDIKGYEFDDLAALVRDASSDTDRIHYVYEKRSWKVIYRGKLHSLKRLTAKM